MSTQATTATKGKKSGRVNSVTQIKVDFVDGSLVDACAKHLGVEVEGPVEARMVQLWGHFHEKTPQARQSICARCNGLSDMHLDLCPYCGHDEALDDKEAAAVKAQSAPPPPLSAATPTTEKDNTMSTAATEGNKKAKKANGASAALAVVDDAKKTMRSEKELDAAVTEVQRLKGEGAVAMWKLGQYMADHIYNNQLWKLRSEEGKPRYKNVDAFCHAELGMTPQNAYKLMSIAKTFSEPQVRAFGTTKLALLLEAPKEERPKIQKRMEAGELSTKREVEREVRAANREIAGTPEGKKKKKARDGSNRGAAVGSTKASAKAAGKQITVAKILGSETVKLFKKPANTRNYEEKDLVRAKKVGDQPFGVLHLTNEVKMYFTVVTNAAGEWSLKTVTVRDDDK